jgi:hypothetical protein
MVPSFFRRVLDELEPILLDRYLLGLEFIPEYLKLASTFSQNILVFFYLSLLLLESDDHPLLVSFEEADFFRLLVVSFSLGLNLVCLVIEVFFFDSISILTLLQEGILIHKDLVSLIIVLLPSVVVTLFSS